MRIQIILIIVAQFINKELVGIAQLFKILIHSLLLVGRHHRLQSEWVSTLWGIGNLLCT